MQGSADPVKVYFAVNSVAVPAETAKMLEGIVTYAKASSSAMLGISGYHDKSGDQATNQELAKNRAMAVKALLLAAGVAEDRIQMAKPMETTGGSDDKEARRVEVYAAK